MIYIVMGVSGCGKTTVGKELAARLNLKFADGDSFHPDQNIEKMMNGIPLNDADRLPWLRDINKYCVKNPETVVACSALKKAYRDILRENAVEIRFLYLSVKRAILEARLESRTGHFMPPSLLDSQFATLEDPTGENDVITITVNNEPVDEIVAKIVETLKM